MSVNVTPDMQAALKRVVDGLTTFVLCFNGPATAHVGGTAYVTLCSHGIKPEGEPAQNFGWQEAIERYGDLLRAMITENRDKQLAWRRSPSVEVGTEGYFVSSRLAFI